MPLDTPVRQPAFSVAIPDVLHRVEDRQIDELAALQGELLARAASRSKTGRVARLCDLLAGRAEGEGRSRRFWTPIRHGRSPRTA